MTAPNAPEAPLAERMRPRTLEDYVGQDHLVGPEATLCRALTAGQLPSMIRWGPPGVGKTTLARLMAEATGRPFHQLSAIHKAAVTHTARYRLLQLRHVLRAPTRSWNLTDHVHAQCKR